MQDKVQKSVEENEEVKMISSEPVLQSSQESGLKAKAAED